MTGMGRGMGGGATELLGIWPTLVDKTLVDPGITCDAGGVDVTEGELSAASGPIGHHQTEHERSGQYIEEV